MLSVQLERGKKDSMNAVRTERERKKDSMNAVRTVRERKKRTA